jgi:mono/diheme cytochrome c family protein
MRIVMMFVLLFGSLMVWAQEPSTKVNKVSVKAVPADSGKEMFGSYCASCHGPDGKGNGPAASAFKVAPADLTLLARKNGGKYPSLAVVGAIKDGTGAHGSKDMPVWGPILLSVSPGGNPVVQQRVTNLTSYIESLQAK